ncbi:2-oxoglutarate dehydrogenase E1 component [Thalassoglobus polymorphus]|uniref:oxoglutarate dehydrogenase (succinyl-transferring) n=1 Tax=Thalassoglobus polymorphus TaxID=2527994 RepID=A0A517QIR9_9PLAN|nr:2-oxoglutarate dehydrogenase E1 component [Thalassoglobus polymorphus]QDT31427.1 2-oxoglutarate dehydrogenase E1 component [Thalassoglobus polymorphus]
MSSPVIPLNSQNLVFVEQLFSSYLFDRDSVSPEWREYFDTVKNGDDRLTSGWSPESPFSARSMFNPPGAKTPMLGHEAPASRLDEASRQERLDQLIRNYRVRGHILASIDPLGSTRSSPAELDPAFYNFQESDFDRDVSTSWVGGPATRTLRGIINWLKQTYCRSIGAQFMHIDSLQVRHWLAQRMEESGNRIKLARDEQIRILQRLSDAVVFEEFLAKKFVGAKSFSLEGAESLIPLLDMAIEKAGNEGVREIVIGMAHRGRLNVLANIMKKSPRTIFREFDDADPELYIGRGDVKYHLGHSANWETSRGNSVHLSLCFNPSHLEFVNTVALGRMRSKMDRYRDFKRERGATILIHGDAAFAGEGIVQETLNLSELAGYRTGGTIHIIVNNQVGFTTTPKEGRSTTYATDVAKMLQIPIFHVNGEDPEAVAQVVTLALDFRKKFKRDVVIDMYCYRRRGHNEGDEPAFTQPVMYKEIRKHATVYEGYLERLLNLRGITRDEAQRIEKERRERLENELSEARRDDFIRCVDHWGGVWGGYQGGPAEEADNPVTGVKREKLTELLNQVTRLPEDFKPHPKAKRLLETRQAMARGEEPLDWGGAEIMALASLLDEERPLRMSGQDVRRGTFSHRHAVLYDNDTGKSFITLKNIIDERGYVNIHNSPLSEAGVLGFEYGYSLDCPEGLTIWEAQFGDFVNAAQVIIDQFIASAEDKWNRLSSLVMLLPHGFEGQGPEHSSARIERFLNLAADDNIQVCQPTTPAQMFHLLRRQVLRRWKKPLVVMTPKSLLRHKECVSTLEDCAEGRFQEILPDRLELKTEEVKQILLCTGKVYYELIQRREELGIRHSMIVRVEQLYPFPTLQLEKLLADFPAEIPVNWVQEEPSNMGAWGFLRIRFGEKFLGKFPFERISRPASASPATGSSATHKMEQDKLLTTAFELE